MSIKMKTLPQKATALLLTGLLVLSICLPVKQAHAIVCCACVTAAHSSTRDHISDGFGDMQGWFLEEFWANNVLPAMMMMSAQMTAVAMQQVQIIGTFLDAKMQLETQQAIAEVHVNAQRMYHPSEQVCAFGSAARGMAASERWTEFSQLVLGRRFIDRGMKSENTSAYNTAVDVSSRMDQFRSTYCNPADINGTLEDFCDGAPPERQNKDIDWTRTVFLRDTLNMRYTGNAPTADEEDVMALLVNFMGNNVINRPFNLDLDDLTQEDKEAFMDFRHLKVLESLAVSAPIEFIARKSSGSGIATPEFYAMAENLGIDAAEVKNELGNNPSLYAQEEKLFNIAYNPNFFINLYDKPENVARVSAGLDGLELLAANRIIKATEKTSLLLAALLTVELENLQEEIEGTR